MPDSPVTPASPEPTQGPGRERDGRALENRDRLARLAREATVFGPRLRGALLALGHELDRRGDMPEGLRLWLLKRLDDITRMLDDIAVTEFLGPARSGERETGIFAGAPR